MISGISPEVRPLVGLILSLGIIASLILALFARNAALAAGLLTAVSVSFTIFFFRDPVRVSPAGERLVISPADGTIIDISLRNEEEYVRDECIRISIFMSLWNVHVNRIPVSGVVEYMNYRRGTFKPAFREISSERNEMQSVGIDTGTHRILTRQIAGILARRIRTYLHKGEEVRAGEKLGLIAFGSRVDIFLPRESRIDVKRGEHMKGGESILGELP
jgi:phosphatidylserine decarboxylase